MSTVAVLQGRRTGSVQKDWITWLPEPSAQLFGHLRDGLTVSCALLAVMLNDVLGAANELSPETSPQMALLFLALFERSVSGLFSVIAALEQHDRVFHTCPNAEPLRPEHFRSRQARYIARLGAFGPLLSGRQRSLFSPKLRALRRVILGLRRQVRNEVREIAGGNAANARAHWTRLEMLQDDLNTCLQETTITLKSFFCALPGDQLADFRNRLSGSVETGRLTLFSRQ